MAQLVEQLIRNQQVAGSSPASSSKHKTPYVYTVFLFFGDLRDVRIPSLRDYS